MITSINQVEASNDSLLHQTQQNVEKLVKENDSEKYDFDRRLERAKQQTKEAAEQARKHNRQSHLQAIMQLYCTRSNLGALGNDVHTSAPEA